MSTKSSRHWTFLFSCLYMRAAANSITPYERFPFDWRVGHTSLAWQRLLPISTSYIGNPQTYILHNLIKGAPLYFCNEKVMTKNLFNAQPKYVREINWIVLKENLCSVFFCCNRDQSRYLVNLEREEYNFLFISWPIGIFNYSCS